jgi:hypothetical protein
MSDTQHDVVMVASGNMPQVEVWKMALADEGIDGRVVGEELTAGLGTAIPESVELWVRQADFERASEVLRTLEAKHGNPQEV